MRFQLGTMRPAGSAIPLGVSTNPKNPQQLAVALGVGEGHRLILGPTGAGKFWATIAPLLLTIDAASAVVVDVAGGEAFRYTGGHRAKLGPVLKLDPYAATAGDSGGLNPLDALTYCQDPDALNGIARSLAEAVVMTTHTGGDSDFWNDAAKDYCTALCLHVATFPNEREKTLGRVRDIIMRDPLMIETPAQPGQKRGETMPTEFMVDMMTNKAAHGLVADYARSLLSDYSAGSTTLFSNARRTLQTQTSFLDDRRVRRSMDRTTLDVRALRDGVATLYLVAPTKELHNLGRWLRLMYTTIMGQMIEEKDSLAYQKERYIPLHVVLDEFGAFGKFERVGNDLVTVRKYGVHLHMAVQKVSHLIKHYGRDGWEQFLPECLHVLGCDEWAGAKYISDLIGTTTRMKASNSQTRNAGSPSTTAGQTEDRQARVFPHELLEMKHDECLVVGRGDNSRLRLAKWWAYADPYLMARLSSFTRRAA